MINTLVIDDERLARQELRSLLTAFPEINIVGEAENVDEGISLIEKHSPQLIFLDIQMPEKTGFDLLEELIQIPLVIFCTAYDEYALKAFESNALDYLLKPVDPNRLKEAVQKVLRQLQETKGGNTLQTELSEDQQVFLKDGDKCWFVCVGDIRLIESVGNYARLYFGDQKALIHRTLNDLEERLGNAAFFRANRKEIINLRQIGQIEPYFSGGLLVILRTGERIEISRRQAIKFREIMSL
ncbi:MAG: response regulator [Sphingobacteriia bacterium]|nr:response regulator [Sphingobacteriia bacterium]